MPEQLAEHENSVQAFFAQQGEKDALSLRPKINSQGQEYLPSQHFSLNRPLNEKRQTLDLTLSTEEAREIFTDGGEDKATEGRDEDNTHLHVVEQVPDEQSAADFLDSFIDDEPAPTQSILSRPSVRPRRSVPSGFRGGSSTVSENGIQKELVRGRTIYSPNLSREEQKGGWAIVPRKEWVLPTNENRIRNSRAFLNSLTADERALNCAQQEPGFKIDAFAAEMGWKIGPARRRQTAFNKKLRAWEEAGGDPSAVPLPAKYVGPPQKGPEAD